jgi:serine/threonine protein kinase
MGIVYEADDERLPRRVALKLLAPELANSPDATRRLRREAEMIARLSHPNICTIYEIDEHDGRAFIAMERLQGLNLKAHMARNKLKTSEIIDIASQIAFALEAAHDLGIVHRDVKPGNVMIGPKGAVKVMDFGLARRFPTSESPDGDADGSTILGRPLGTASYMAPERILQLPLDARCDLFSLGVVIYEMATGRLPFTGASTAETVENILDKNPVPLRTLAPERPVALERIVSRLAAKRADERYQSASELREALVAAGNRPGAGLFGRLFNKSRAGPNEKNS